MVSEKIKKLKRVVSDYKRRQEKSKHANKAVLGLASDVLNETEFIPFGIDSLNRFIGADIKPLGIPRGMVTSVGGAPQSGKTRLLLKTIGHNMKLDPDFIAVWADAEGALDASTIQQFDGMDPERFILIDKGDAEDLLIATMELLNAEVVDMVVVDSIAALCPRGELQDTAGRERTVADNQVALQARVLSQFLRMAVGSGAIKRSKTAFVFIAQVRSTIGQHGNPLAVVGGNAVKHYSRLILEFRRGSITDDLKEDQKLGATGKTYKKHLGFPCVIKLTKTNFGPNETAQISIPFLFEEGFDELSADIGAAITGGLIQKAGGWYNCHLLPNGKVQGKERVFSFFKENPDKLSILMQDGIPESTLDDSISESIVEEVAGAENE